MDVRAPEEDFSSRKDSKCRGRYFTKDEIIERLSSEVAEFRNTLLSDGYLASIGCANAFDSPIAKVIHLSRVDVSGLTIRQPSEFSIVMNRCVVIRTAIESKVITNMQLISSVKVVDLLIHSKKIGDLVFRNIDAEGVVMPKCLLKGCVFEEVKLTGWKCVGCRSDDGLYSKIECIDSSMMETRFTNCKFVNVVFSNVAFDDAVFAKCNFVGVTFEGQVCLTKVKLKECDLTMARGYVFDDTSTVNCKLPPVRSWIAYWLLFVYYIVAYPFRYIKACATNNSKLNISLLPSSVYNDPWSVLTQNYSGPRSYMRYVSSVLFAVPYIYYMILFICVAIVPSYAMRGLRDVLGKIDRKIGEIESALENKDSSNFLRGRLGLEAKLVSIQSDYQEMYIIPDILSGTLKYHSDIIRKIDAAITSSDFNTAVMLHAMYKYHLIRFVHYCKLINEKIAGRLPTEVSVAKLIIMRSGASIHAGMAILLILYYVVLYIMVTAISALAHDVLRSSNTPRYYDYRYYILLHNIINIIYPIVLFKLIADVYIILFGINVPYVG